MKIAFLLTAAAATLGFSETSFVASIPAAVAAAPVASSAVQWRTTQHNFGEIVQAVPVTATFTFRNTGKVPVLLTQVQGSCGCTATSYPTEAIQPGQSAAITATFNAANLGGFNKTVTVTTNTADAPQVLTLRGTVVVAK
ncbi:DUF1573 domain-containing protein [Hymenobacter weizhouensis]|uniref:DUF1573 domain-containing protein n=1 Tax=Hymenobacter sp. YIM 151500-1 TaxID=2987689 RepID=UPI00222682FC|nr:DUF1573 domain-containing protein [Hymenobacter sp. YIM 151500-1]UYZ62055.1 DUF1573 domain-containing protein [Hymenobacter sp. YIM 151500-1]